MSQNLLNSSNNSERQQNWRLSPLHRGIFACDYIACERVGMSTFLRGYVLILVSTSCQFSHADGL